MQFSAVVWTAMGTAPLNSSQATGNVSGRIAAIAAHYHGRQHDLCRGSRQGVWKTIRWRNKKLDSVNGYTERVVDGRGGHCSKNNPLVIYAGTGEADDSVDSDFGRGILVSANGGTSFTLNTGPGGVFSAGSDDLFADRCRSQRRQYRLRGDGGLRQQRRPHQQHRRRLQDDRWRLERGERDDGQRQGVHVLVVRRGGTSKRDQHRVCEQSAAMFGTANNGVYKSTDSGATWTLLNAAPAPVGTAFGRISISDFKSQQHERALHRS